MHTPDFSTLEYLKTGNAKQQHAYAVLTQLGLFKTLKNYEPLLAGTIPINIDLPHSDLDIVCQCTSSTDFQQTVTHHYKNLDRFEVRKTNKQGLDTLICSFYFKEIKIELFAQDRPSKEQHAYRHMLIEHEILCAKGEPFRQKVILLKKQGLSTEHAFAELLGISGDPYEALLSFKLE